jgi:hypothetical protein
MNWTYLYAIDILIDEFGLVTIAIKKRDKLWKTLNGIDPESFL